jgi:cytochrome c oxidase subunit 2
MRIGLLLALLLITCATVVLFVAHPWWFPAPASAQAGTLDQQFRIAIRILGSLFIAAQLLLGFVILRSRRDRAKYLPGKWQFEVVWTLAIAALFFWFNIRGEHLWGHMTREAQPDAVQVEVTGAQFQWYFRYPGADGKFGRTDAQKFARPDEGNPLGIDPNDPAGADDIVSNSMVVPEGRDIALTLQSQDVIHSLFIPAMRFKQDAVPGMHVQAQLTPIASGVYEISCAELCGLGHYRMRSVVRVLSQQEFEQWLKSHAQHLSMK